MHLLRFGIFFQVENRKPSQCLSFCHGLLANVLERKRAEIDSISHEPPFNAKLSLNKTDIKECDASSIHRFLIDTIELLISCCFYLVCICILCKENPPKNKSINLSALWSLKLKIKIMKRAKMQISTILFHSF